VAPPGRLCRAGWPANGIEVTERLRVGARQAALAVRHASLPAERLDQGLRAAQVGPWHGGEQVVLDLVVQAAKREIGEPAAAHIARGERLAAQEVALIGGLQDGHALVVGREGAPQVQAEQALLHDHEHHRPDGREHQEHHSQVAGRMNRDQRPLPEPAAGGPAGQPLDARDVQVDPFQQQQREEQVSLIAEHQPGQAAAGASLGPG
jgi:hypothetical protein